MIYVVYRNAPVYLGHFFQLLSTGRFCFFLPPGVNKKVVQQVLSASLPFFPRNSVAKGVTAYFPGMRPCFDLNFPVLCCLVVQPSSVAPLTGLLENRTPFFFFLSSSPERGGSSAVSHRLWLCGDWLPDFVCLKLWGVTADMDQLKRSSYNSTSYSLLFHLDLLLS